MSAGLIIIEIRIHIQNQTEKQLMYIHCERKWKANEDIHIGTGVR